MFFCVVGMGNMFGETKLTLGMDKHEEMKFIVTELWDRFLEYAYVLTFFILSHIAEI